MLSYEGRGNLFCNCSNYFQPCPHSPLRVIFMGSGVTKVHQNSITKILSDVTFITLNDLSTRLLIGTHHLAQLFGIKPRRKDSGVNEVTEHDRELTPFGGRRFSVQSSTLGV